MWSSAALVSFHTIPSITPVGAAVLGTTGSLGICPYDVSAQIHGCHRTNISNDHREDEAAKPRMRFPLDHGSGVCGLHGQKLNTGGFSYRSQFPD